MKTTIPTTIGFGSDNHSGVHPELLATLSNCNQGHAPSYGTDHWTETSIKAFQELFEAPVDVFYCFNGTACNVLALQSFARQYHSILVSEVSHLNVDECGSPEATGGFKLIPIEHHNGKIEIKTLEKYFIRRGDQHFSQVQGISITQPTELGTVYTVQEITEICKWAHQKNLFVHMDGARIANAVVSLDTTFKKMCVESGVDVLSFGGTKNGLMMGEAIVFLNRSLARDFKFIRKQMGQLPSKTRFIAAQFDHYIRSGLWKKTAEHSLAMAQYLKKTCESLSEVQLIYPVESNAVFAKFPREWLKPLREEYFFYVWDENDFSARWMCTWDTQKSDIDGFVNRMRTLSIKA